MFKIYDVPAPTIITPKNPSSAVEPVNYLIPIIIGAVLIIAAVVVIIIIKKHKRK